MDERAIETERERGRRNSHTIVQVVVAALNWSSALDPFEF